MQINILSQDNLMDKESLMTQYQTFIRVAYMDWPVFKPMLVNACKLGYNTLHVCLHSICTTIQLQHSRAFTSNISNLGQLIDHFKIQTNQASKQLEMDRAFQEDLTRQLNSFTTSVAGLSEKLDNKTLELSRPTTRVMTPAATPTADSASSPQTEIPGKIELIPQTVFKSQLITVSINASSDVSIRPNVQRAKPLCIIASLSSPSCTCFKGRTLIGREEGCTLTSRVDHAPRRLRPRTYLTRRGTAAPLSLGHAIQCLT